MPYGVTVKPPLVNVTKFQPRLPDPIWPKLTHSLASSLAVVMSKAVWKPKPTLSGPEARNHA